MDIMRPKQPVGQSAVEYVQVLWTTAPCCRLVYAKYRLERTLIKGLRPSVRQSVRSFELKKSLYLYKNLLVTHCHSPIYILLTQHLNQDSRDRHKQTHKTVRPQYHECRINLKLWVLVKCVNNGALTPQQLLTISKRLVAASNESSTDLTSTTALDQVTYCRVFLHRVHTTSKCPHIRNPKRFIPVCKRNFHNPQTLRRNDSSNEHSPMEP